MTKLHNQESYENNPISLKFKIHLTFSYKKNKQKEITICDVFLMNKDNIFLYLNIPRKSYEQSKRKQEF